MQDRIPALRAWSSRFPHWYQPTETTKQPAKRWAINTTFEVRKHGVLYLRRRRLIQTPLFGIYLHHIHLPDGDRHPHNHPWWFASLILRGGYVEQTTRRPLSGRLDTNAIHHQHRRRFTIHTHPLARYHRLSHVNPRTITLVIVGPRLWRTWGFLTEVGHIPWNIYGDGADPGPDA